MESQVSIFFDNGSFKIWSGLICLLFLQILLLSSDTLYGQDVSKLIEPGANNNFIDQVEPELNISILFPGTEQISQFNKLELGVLMPVNIENAVKEFMNPPHFTKGLNPYDPEMIDLFALFYAPSGKIIRVNGFYSRNFERTYCTPQTFPCWVEKPSAYSWKIRFSPPEPGEWRVVVQLNSNENGQSVNYSSKPIPFSCVSSENHGFIGSSSRNLVFPTTGKPFIPIGINTDWYRWGIVNSTISERYAEYFDEIHENGGNLASLALLNRTGLQFEWEHLGVYENPGAINNSFDYNSNRQAHAWEIDHIIELAEQKGIYLKFTLLQHPDFEKDFWNWPENPYHQFIGSVVNPIDFFTNDTASAYFKNKLRYISARWGYSTHIAWYELLTEIDNIKGFTENQKQVYLWFDQMASALKTNDNNNHLVSGSYSTFEKDNDPELWVWHSKNCDLVNIHSYGQNKRTNYNRFKDVQTLKDKFPGKPLLFGEIGSYTGSEVESATDVQFHNNLWATLFMGTAGPGLNWHWEAAIPGGYSRNFKSLKEFSEMIDFRKNWTPRRFPLFKGLTLRGRNYKVENFYMVEGNRQSAIGWIHNATYYWYNLGLPGISNPNGNKIMPGDDDKWSGKRNFQNKFSRIAGLKMWKNYCFTTYLIKEAGLFPQPPLTLFSNIAGQIDIPTWKYFYQSNDFAYVMNIGKCSCEKTSEK